MAALGRQVPLTQLRWSAQAGASFLLGKSVFQYQSYTALSRRYATESKPKDSSSSSTSSGEQTDSSTPSSASTSSSSSSSSQPSSQRDWEDDTNFNISTFSQLPYKDFGVNQHMIVNAEFKEALRQVLWQFRAPIRYAFAYGSGVFPQSHAGTTSSTSSPHPQPPEAVTKWQASGGKIIDFIFGVSYTQHWHDLNIQQHRDHYSLLGSFGSAVVSKVQDNFGAGAYFNPFITVNGLMIKYGVLNLDTIYQDLSNWETLYIAGRLQKPVKILRDDPRIRLANQVNLISALRTALLMLPDQFTEQDLYQKIAGISYMGDPRMYFKAENPDKVANIVGSQMANFRQLYSPLIEDLPNVVFNDPNSVNEDWATNPDYNFKLQQDMDPHKRGNMVRRLPKAFRKKIYNAYRGVYEIPESVYEGLVQDTAEDDAFSSREGGEYDQKIASDKNLENMVSDAIKQTVMWPTINQTVKSVFTAGISRSWKYYGAKRAKGKAGKQKAEEGKEPEKAPSDPEKQDSEKKT